MNHELVIRPEAEADLAEAYAWYERCVPGLGDEFLLSVDASLHAVGRNPRQYPVVFKATRRALLSRFPYAIFFVIDQRRVTVLAVFHVTRDPKRWKRRR